ncbi:MAG TPA: PP2C family serine/threonine-protein phosphatase [Motilibacteraceae bacterium]|nr:PP2C family serine/threonine-protein phosphatase [Motilibacteraceae bacterium]
MALALRFAARSDVGLLRDGNEDSGYAGPRLLVVADGMGGHAAGEVASSVAVASLAALDEDSPGPDLLDRLATAVETANAHLHDMVEGDPALAGMGTTLTALLRAGPRVGLVHVGDSRCYLLRDGELVQVTRDHTFVQTLVDEGRISKEDAGSHPQRNLILNALQGQDPVELDLSVREMRKGDRWLLCSDGLTGVVSDESLHRTLLGTADTDAAADTLVDLALRGGAPDNVTVIVADVVDVETSPSTVPSVVGAVASGPVRYDRERGTGAAERAAALRRASDGAADGADGQPSAEATDVGDDRPGRRWLRRGLLGALAVLLLGGLAWAGTAWARSQYYVGAHQNQVAIFRGLPQDLLGLRVSQLESQSTVPLDALSDYSRTRVRDGITARGLADAQRIVGLLEQEARTGQRPDAGLTGTPTPLASPSAAPSASPSSTAPTPGATALPTQRTRAATPPASPQDTRATAGAGR